MEIWNDLTAVVLDMDGVIFIGRQPRPGIKELLLHFERSGMTFHVLTNTSASTRQEIAANLARMGLRIDSQRITTSSELVATYVRTHTTARRVLTIGGGRGLAGALRASGIDQLDLARLPMTQVKRLAKVPPPIALPLILGWTRRYDYALATKALRLERCISDIYITGVDRFYADDSGNMPGVLWLSGSIAALLDKTPINPAKPNPYALTYVLGKLHQPASRTAVIGDSITDVQSGNAAGCRTILVLGGATHPAELEGLEGGSIPSLIVRELTELLT